MFDRKPLSPDRPKLLDRVLEHESRRVAVLGLHPRAGARTVLAALAGQIQRRSLPLGVTSVPRLPFESELITSDPVTRIALRPDALVATAEQAADSARMALELVESTPWSGPLGAIQIYRVRDETEVDLYGPDAPEPLEGVLERLAELSGGFVLVDGGWERRIFAAPGITDAMVVVFSAGYSATPERSAAAARYNVDVLKVSSCDPQLARAWNAAAGRGAVGLLDAAGTAAGILPPGIDDPLSILRGGEGPEIATVLLPYGLNDEFLIPIVRSTFRCRLVIRDATRLSLAPVYFKAWHKGGGRIEVVRPANILAIATNPFNHAGPDSDPGEFRGLVEAAVPGISVHDVVLEAEDGPRKPVWKFWM